MKTYSKSKTGYMVSPEGTYEHRDVWEAAHGKIPPTCHVHHKNKVRHDNRLENLECIEAEAHLRMHGLSFECLNALRKARARPKREFSCVKCGKPAASVHPLAKFCSLACCRKSRNDELGAARSKARAEARGAADCPVCGKHFTRTRRGQINCTRRCTMVGNARKRNKALGHRPTPSFYRT